MQSAYPGTSCPKWRLLKDQTLEALSVRFSNTVHGQENKKGRVSKENLW